jgi:hypothetical protein
VHESANWILKKYKKHNILINSTKLLGGFTQCTRLRAFLIGQLEIWAALWQFTISFVALSRREVFIVLEIL